MRDPTGDQERRRRQNRQRFILISAVLVAAVMVICLGWLFGLLGRQVAGVWMTEQQGEVEMREQDCVAKAACLEWAAGTIGDSQLRKFYTQVSSEWLKEAHATKGMPDRRREPDL